MKKIFLLLFAAGSFLCLSAQTVTVTVKGDRNRQILIDGQSYSVNTDVSSTTDVNVPITVSNLSLGQHTLQVMRSNRNNTSTVAGMKATFTLRTGYDMNVTVTANGSILLSEKKTQAGTSTGYRSPMSDADFDVLLNNIERQRNQSRRATAINNAFARSGNYFSTEQVYELLSTITSQAQRLSLAKTAYPKVVDGENYDDVYPLITSRARRAELDRYVDGYNNSNPGHIGSANMAMSATDFDVLYRNAQGQWPASAKMSYISTQVFGPASYYYTTDQAKRMISIMSTEAERLQLAKEAYDNLVRPSAYTELNSLLTYQSSRNELANYVNNSNLDNPRQPMTATRYNELYLSARQQWSYSERVLIIREAFTNNTNYFTSTQAKELIELVSAESDRLSLAKLAWDNVTDPANYAQFYDLFTTTASRNDFNAFLNASAAYTGGTTVTPVVTAMTETDFNSLYYKISNQWGLGVKMNSLTEVMANAANHFTVAQAKKLITLVSAEYNRLDLAKAAYDNIVDRDNFSQIYDIFENQTSVNELKNFVSSYPANQ